MSKKSILLTIDQAIAMTLPQWMGAGHSANTLFTPSSDDPGLAQKRTAFLCLAVAIAAHNHQTYGGGSFVENHLMPVTEVAGGIEGATGPEYAYVSALAAVHDLLEDCEQDHGGEAILALLREIGGERLATDVVLLTRRPGVLYADYMHAICASGNRAVLRVKLADSLGNFSQCLQEQNYGRAQRYADNLPSLTKALHTLG